jgi:hypothetical protein
MNATFFFEKMSEMIIRGDGMDLVTFAKKFPYQVHPEIVDIPGSVQDDRNSHGAYVRILVPYISLTGGNPRFT